MSECESNIRTSWKIWTVPENAGEGGPVQPGPHQSPAHVSSSSFQAFFATSVAILLASSVFGLTPRRPRRAPLSSVVLSCRACSFLPPASRLLQAGPSLLPPRPREPCRGRPDNRPPRPRARAPADSGRWREGASGVEHGPLQGPSLLLRAGRRDSGHPAAWGKGRKAGPRSGFLAERAAGAKALLRHAKFRQNCRDNVSKVFDLAVRT